MQRFRWIALAWTALALVVALLSSAPSASAATPAVQQYNPDEIFNDTYNDYGSALNLTTNQSQKMRFYLDCPRNDFDFFQIWQPAGRDLSIHIETEPGISFRFAAALKTPEYFIVVEKEVRPQAGVDSEWYNTTTRITGTYWFTLGGGNTCPTPAEFYNITWDSVLTASANDGDNSLASAATIVDGLWASGSVTETADQADFFKVTTTLSGPAYDYLFINNDSLDAAFHFEFYNSTGVTVIDPQTHQGFDANTTAFLLLSKGIRLPAAGTYYLRIWSAGLSGAYSINFSIVQFTPSFYITYQSAKNTTDDSNDSSTLDEKFESEHYYRILISRPNTTIWVEAWTNQFDMQVVLKNESFSGIHSSKAASRNIFNPSADPKDFERLSYTVAPQQFANTTGWWYIVVSFDNNLSGTQGLYHIEIWLNDAPAPVSRAETRPEDTPVVNFNASTLFNDPDNDTLTITLLTGGTSNVTVDFSDGRWVNATPAANWFGSECRQFRAADPKNLSSVAQLCFTFTAVNDAPSFTGVAIYQTMFEDQTKSDVLISSWFTDVDGDPLTYSVSGNENISVVFYQLGGETLASFTPDLNFHGFNNLTFTAMDPMNLTVSITIEFNVVPVNDPPTVSGSLPQVYMDEDTQFTMSMLNVVIFGVAGPAFVDIDGDSLIYRVYNPVNVTVSITGWLLTIRPDPNFTGLASFTVAAFDGIEESVRAPVLVRVNATNDGPVITVFAPTTNPAISEGESRSFSVTASDVDGDAITYQWFLGSTGVPGETRNSYTLRTEITDERNRTVVVRVTVSDGQVTVEHSWTVTIVNTNQPPRDVSITSPPSLQFLTTDEIPFSATATDPDGDTLTFTWYSDKQGTAIGTSQTFTAKLPAGVNKIRLLVSDGQVTVEATMSLTVSAPPPPQGGFLAGFEAAATVAGAAAAAVAVAALRRRRH